MRSDGYADSEADLVTPDRGNTNSTGPVIAALLAHSYRKAMERLAARELGQRECVHRSLAGWHRVWLMGQPRASVDEVNADKKAALAPWFLA